MVSRFGCSGFLIAVAAAASAGAQTVAGPLEAYEGAWTLGGDTVGDGCRYRFPKQTRFELGKVRGREGAIVLDGQSATARFHEQADTFTVNFGDFRGAGPMNVLGQLQLWEGRLLVDLTITFAPGSDCAASLAGSKPEPAPTPQPAQPEKPPPGATAIGPVAAPEVEAPPPAAKAPGAARPSLVERALRQPFAVKLAAVSVLALLLGILAALLLPRRTARPAKGPDR